MFNPKLHQERYEAWLNTLSPEQRQLHEERAQAAAERMNIEFDIRWQHDGPHKKVLPCECCGVKVIHCGVWPFGAEGEMQWRVSQDHRAPCGRICLLSSEASHFGGVVLRAFADSPDCHRGRFCVCQQSKKKRARPSLKIPVKALRK
jgi:hypothetical protein